MDRESETAEQSMATPQMVECPAGICSREVAIFDHDRMFGHLLSHHSWTFETAESWVIENMPEESQ